MIPCAPRSCRAVTLALAPAGCILPLMTRCFRGLGVRVGIPRTIRRCRRGRGGIPSGRGVLRGLAGDDRAGAEGVVLAVALGEGTGLEILSEDPVTELGMRVCMMRYEDV